MTEDVAQREAWVAQALGEPSDVLRLTATPAAAAPAPGHVRVQTAAIGLNWADVLTCRGTYQVRCDPPFTPGLEAAGTIALTGADVDDSWRGRRVVALAVPPHGAFATTFDVALDAVVPTDVDANVAAAMFVNYHTAHVGLTRRCTAETGSTVLVHGAAGGTGGAAVQVAKALGATVIGTCRGAAKAAVAQQNGADHTIDLAETNGQFVETVKELTAGRGVDVVFDTIGGPGFDQTRRCVGWEGVILVVGAAGGVATPPPLGHVLVKNYSIVGLHWSAYAARHPAVLRESQVVLDGWLQSGKITPHISAVRPFHEVPAALAQLADGTTVGKVVIEL